MKQGRGAVSAQLAKSHTRTVKSFSGSARSQASTACFSSVPMTAPLYRMALSTPPGRRASRACHGRTVGYGDYGARRCRHRILVGLIRGHFLLIFLLLIFLLLFGIEIGEPQEKRRHDDNT